LTAASAQFAREGGLMNKGIYVLSNLVFAAHRRLRHFSFGTLQPDRGRIHLLRRFLTTIVWACGEESYVVSVNDVSSSNLESDLAVIFIPNIGVPKTIRAEAKLSDDAAVSPDRSGTSIITGSTPELQRPASTPLSHVLVPKLAASAPGQKMLRAMKFGFTGGHHNKGPSKFVATYRSVLKFLAIMELPRILQNATLTPVMVVGTASTYDPYKGGEDAGSFETASGEPYDPRGWTAAIQTDLREQFGGIRYGRLYRPAYALVEIDNKQLIVKINDVGPLRPDRVIDLNERSMRYFDPFLQRGLIRNVTVTLLPGEDWTTGPVGGKQPINFASLYARESQPAQLAQPRATLKHLADRTDHAHGDLFAKERERTCQEAGACISPVALHFSPDHGRSQSLKPSL
jgi:rare lipoprotein A